jgi:hypothetical protein
VESKKKSRRRTLAGQGLLSIESSTGTRAQWEYSRSLWKHEDNRKALEVCPQKKREKKLLKII